MLELWVAVLLWLCVLAALGIAAYLFRVLPLLVWDLITKGHLRDWD